MGWWKCSNKLYLTEPVISLSENRGKYAAGKIIRIYSFIRLLDFSSEGFCFASHEHLSKVTGNQIGQCQIVWDICIKYGVLRKTKGGYSAREWMEEQGLLPEEEPKQIVQEKQIPEIKEQVRPNVRLSRSELDALRKDYPDEKVAHILDTLSKYKTEKGKYYASDYDAIRRWVCRAVEKSGNINQPEKIDEESFTSPFPDWIYGNKEECHDKG